MSLEEINNAIFDDLEESEIVYFPRVRQSVSPRVLSQLKYEAKAKTFLQSKIAEAEGKLRWPDKPEDIFKLKDALYALTQRVANKKGESSAISVLNWCTERHVHVAAALKVLNKALKT